MKRYISLLLVTLVTVLSLAACGGSASSDGARKSTAGFSVVVTIFPEYDWVMNILGDNPADMDVAMLLGNGVDMHSYQPTTDDIIRISDCDLFIYVGGESDEWIEDALSEATNKDMQVINLLDVLGDRVKEEEVVEGMEAEPEEEKESSEEELEYDEHVWLSLKNAIVIVDEIESKLAAIDPENADIYAANASAYNDELAALDAEYEEAVSSAAKDTVLFGDRFPYRYLADDYGLTYYAAFAGCSAETEASFETVMFLSQKVDELSLGTILTIEGADHRIAETIRDNTAARDQQILTMDSMQATTTKDVESGVTYLSVMTQNLEVLKEALD